MTQVKDLGYYKNNAEEDYMTTPISVLRYIGELEAELQKTTVVRQREQLECKDCGYEINQSGICINMSCSTNENP